MSINKAILIGNVGRDPEIRFIENNVPIARFSLATSERGYTAANGTRVPDRSEWHTVVAWRGLADIAEKYIRKGTQLYVEGKITYRSWEDKNGITRYSTEIIADNIQLLGSRKSESAPAQQEGESASGTTGTASPASATPQNSQASQTPEAPQAAPETPKDVNNLPF